MPRSALIVDDSRTALVTLSRLLSARGVRADTAESGPEALDYLRHNAHPGLIFLDHMMPGMDGFETLAALKRDARTAPKVRRGDASHGGAVGAKDHGSARLREALESLVEGLSVAIDQSAGESPIGEPDTLEIEEQHDLCSALLY